MRIVKDQEMVRRQERAEAELLGQFINCQSLPRRLDLAKWGIDVGARFGSGHRARNIE